MSKNAETSAPILPFLAHRWSPRAFGATPIAPEALVSAFEAARWMPSANNRQPWAFVATHRGEPGFAALCDSLNPNNLTWAQHAGALVLAVAKTVNDDGSANPLALYDLGQAVGAFVAQASSDGFYLHQIGGFDAVRAGAALGVPEGWRPVTVIAIGALGDAASLPAALLEREIAPRQRKPLAEVVHPGLWQAVAVAR